MPGPVVSVRTYIVTAAVLLLLAGATYGIAFIDLGVFNTVIALAIAAAKMTLVALIFMHIRYSKGLPRMVILFAFFWLALLIAFTVADPLTRDWIPAPPGWGR